MDKLAIYDTLLARLTVECDRMRLAAKDTADRAMEGEGRMKSRYDTKRIEGSYLADSLSRRLEDLLRQVARAAGWSE